VVTVLGAGGGVSDLQGAYDGGFLIDIGANPVDLAKDGDAATRSVGLRLSNDTPATSDVGEYAPLIQAVSQVWNGSASKTMSFDLSALFTRSGAAIEPGFVFATEVDGGGRGTLISIIKEAAATTIRGQSTNYWSWGGYTTSAGTLVTGDQDHVMGYLELRDGLIMTGPIQMYDNEVIGFGGVNVSPDSAVDWSTAVTNETLVWGLGDTSKNIIFCDYTDRGTNWATPNFLNPTTVWQSNTTTVANYGYIHHDDTNFILGANVGGVHAIASSVEHDLINDDFGEIYITAGVTNQTTNASAGTFDLMTGWNTAQGANGESNGCTNAKASNKITLSKAGRYRVDGSFSFSGTANATITLRCYLAAAAQTQLTCERKLSAGGDTGNMSFSGYVDAAASDDIDVRVASDGASDTFTPTECNFNVKWVGV
jgi:hypothetical protein